MNDEKANCNHSFCFGFIKGSEHRKIRSAAFVVKKVALMCLDTGIFQQKKQPKHGTGGIKNAKVETVPVLWLSSRTTHRYERVRL